ncbi:MAG: hypothetical protein KAG84_07045 [Bacteroidales bacterium]|nr:hypothetical protein [Bacteroidales bacterium]
MANLNIDKQFQDKLNDLKCDYKPEYWNKMDKVLSSSTLGNVGVAATQTASSSFTTGLIATVSTAIVLTCCISYYSLNSNDDTSISEVTDNIELKDNNIEANINLSENKTKVIESKEIISEDIIAIHTVNATSKKKVKITANSNVVTDNSIVEVENTELFTKSNTELLVDNTSKDTDCNEVDLNTITIDELDTESFDNQIEDDKVELLNTDKTIIAHDTDATKPRTKDVNSQKAKVDNSELKNVKPMRKPSGKVFKRKHSFFKWLSGNK